MGLLYVTTPIPIVPGQAPAELAHASNFERFDGLEIPTTAGRDENQLGTAYGATPRPGGVNTPVVEQTYTAAPIRGVVGTVGGQPLPVADWLYAGDRGYTPSETPSIQHRLGSGQAYQGAAQTVALSEITNNPPIPGDLSGIIAGWA